MVTTISTISTTTTTLVLLLVILASLCNLSHTKATTSKINKGQSISVSETIVSPNGVFELGFFQPQKDSQNRYVGIWYKNISEDKTVSEFNCVWVANRDYPALTPSAILTIHTDGNVVISDGRMLYVITNITSSASNVTVENRQAVLLDYGNFVLRDGDLPENYPLWQSFDYPTNTLLPGMKLIRDADSSSLVSWKSEDDPSPGSYSLRLDSVKRQIIIIMEGNKTFNVMDENNSRGLVDSMVSNDYFDHKSDLPEIYRLVLTESGKLEQESWSALKQCWNSDAKCLDKVHKKGHEGFTKVYIITVVTVLLAILLFAALVFTRIRKLQGKGENLLLLDVEMSLKHNRQELPELNHKRRRGEKNSSKLTFFSFSSVRTATENFSDANKVGEGGFGPVYKGTLLKGDEVAVKRLSTKSGQGNEQFKNEAHLIARLQHKNLVRLLGCCVERKEQILIYEYMPNKSLDLFLFDSTRRKHLKWPIRVNIIEGIAQGLLYLHKYSRIKIVHRDLKPGNILLDIDMNPRISDFGLARIFSINQLQQNAERPVGTFGYMSPESGQQGLFSEKSDIYSFGVLFLEILSGKRNTHVHNAETRGLVAHAWELWTSDRTMDLLDPLIVDDPTAIRAIIRYVHIALLCVQELASDRPNMSQVLSMLCNSTEVLPYPNQPGFLNSTSFAGSRGLRANNPVETRPEVFSVNEVSLSVLDPR